MLPTGSGERNVNCRCIVSACAAKTRDVTGGGGGGISDCSKSKSDAGDDNYNERCEASAAWTLKPERTRRYSSGRPLRMKFFQYCARFLRLRRSDVLGSP